GCSHAVDPVEVSAGELSGEPPTLSAGTVRPPQAHWSCKRSDHRLVHFWNSSRYRWQLYARFAFKLPPLFLRSGCLCHQSTNDCGGCEFHRRRMYCSRCTRCSFSLHFASSHRRSTSRINTWVSMFWGHLGAGLGLEVSGRIGCHRPVLGFVPAIQWQTGATAFCSPSVDWHATKGPSRRIADRCYRQDTPLLNLSEAHRKDLANHQLPTNEVGS